MDGIIDLPRAPTENIMQFERQQFPADITESAPLFRERGHINLAKALRERELGRTAKFRTGLYNGIVPNRTCENVRGLPHVFPLRFTACGRFLVAIARNHVDLVLFRLEGGGRRANWPKARETRRGERENESCEFARFFSTQYTVPIANTREVLFAEFCLSSARGRFLILASFVAAPQDDDADAEQPPPADGRLPGLRECPVLERFTLHLVEVETGRVYDRFVLENDFVQLEGHPGVDIRANMLCVLSLRFQTLHVLRVQESIGRFVQECAVGNACHPDDDAMLARVGAGPVDANEDDNGDVESGLGNGRRRNSPYSGLMQRLLTYVFRSYSCKGNRRKFFEAVGKYSPLVMLRAQLLDNDHVLVLLGGDPSDNATAGRFFIVYCLSRSTILHLYEDSSVALLRIFEHFRDMFYADPMVAAADRHRLVSFSDAVSRSDASSRAREALSALPLRPLMTSASPYLDRTLFSYELERNLSTHAQSGNCFTSRQSGAVRFRVGARTRSRIGGVNALLEIVAHADRADTKTSYLFHPSLPFVVSVVSAGVSRQIAFHMSTT